MNIKSKLYTFAGLLSLFALTACNDYLDKLPDDRAQVNTGEKVEKLLVDAYPTHLPNFIFEMSSDNVTDNGSQYYTGISQEEMYRFKDVDTQGNDDPYSLWNNFYKKVGTANEALADLKEIGDTAAYPAEYAEALLCRAFNMYELANIFCMDYNPDSADVYLGLPYPTEPEQSVNTKYKRGTLKELYASINRDIEAALPRVNDSYMTTPKYHFNQNAAFAFAARFNLMYHNYDKAIEYATKVLGTNPANRLRDYSAYTTLGANDLGNAYIKSEENANLLILPAYSSAGRAFQGSTSYRRFAHNQTMTSRETFWAPAPWGTGSTNNTLYYATMLYGSTQQIYFPKVREHFEVTDKVNDTGYPHIIDMAFTTEETLLVRAEAYALKKDYANALADMNTWIVAHCQTAKGSAKRPTLTEANVNTYMDGVKYSEVTPTANSQRTIKKVLHPQGFTVEEGTQENLIQLILQMRRLETWGEGLRFIDIKRYGIEFTHFVGSEDPIIFHAADKRGAIQLPSDVINAGLEANPR